VNYDDDDTLPDIIELEAQLSDALDLLRASLALVDDQDYVDEVLDLMAECGASA
jgi:hypothetical protein